MTLPLLGGLAIVVANLLLAPALPAADAPKVQPAAGDLVLLMLDLPRAAFIGTPPEGLKTNSYTEPYDPDKPHPQLMVPRGLKNLAPGSKLTCSATNITAEALAKLTDDDKDGSSDSITILSRGKQWVQLDLDSSHEIYAIMIWHAHDMPKVYHDVIVQVADAPEFKQQVRTLFNNDQDNSSGLGVGTDREYFETHQGRLINPGGVKARYIRFCSKGSTQSALNEYTELEVFGRPAK